MTKKNTMKWIAVGATALAVATILAVLAGAARAEGVRWSGVYVGATLGYGSTTTKADADITGVGTILSVDGLGSSGHTMGLVVGADLQIDRLVIGAFADWTKHDQTWSASSPLLAPGNLASLDIESQWTFGGRAGITVGNSLLYGLIGYTRMQTSDIDVPPAALTLAVPDLKGWVLGGGIDVALGNGLFLGAEYRFTRFDSVDVAIVPGFASLNLDPETHEVKARLTYKLGTDALNNVK